MSAGDETTVADADSEELLALREAVRDFLAARSDEAAVREVMIGERGYDEKVWSQMAEQLGLQSLVLPEAHGGDDAGFVALSVVLEEMGRALLPAPFFSSVVLAATALVAAGDDEAAGRLLPGIAAGTTLATLAAPGPDGAWHTGEGALAVAASPADGGGLVLDGTAGIVLDGATADEILLVVAAPEGPTLVSVPGDASGLTRTALRTLDPTRRFASLTLAQTPATVIGQPGAAGPVLAQVLDVATAALAAEQVGGARACLETATAYAKDRVQFGRQIGSFQAVKHKLADMLARVQLADAAAREAAAVLDGADPEGDPGVASAVAHIVASEAYMSVAAENIQVHGGIGFTWEHPAHLYFRRAKSSQLLFGGPNAYHERLLARVGI
ncbi:putative acyl-CoA dehydrogenase [Frankia canadensis]|uniref:Putative acyl-CoA dehydrogenase n=1 Tax=Frankia canadensis TaxID=1836972 RepID=A0A2I2KMB8_9ACTN|nr:acyl-CoA dehydrogenase family protein [Frankia canadensis]SNQ46810.1 putative acyl-CoA dehydrogenase [Frankia canadensis]SOU54100.1 putative acyl-CoA dehydrogenase [Frankia canadensis]